MMPTQGGDNRGQKIHTKNENGISVHRHCSIKSVQLRGWLSSKAMVSEPSPSCFFCDKQLFVVAIARGGDDSIRTRRRDQP
jgi:hypothetical protein